MSYVQAFFLFSCASSKRSILHGSKHSSHCIRETMGPTGVVRWSRIHRHAILPPSQVREETKAVCEDKAAKSTVWEGGMLCFKLPGEDNRYVHRRVPHTFTFSLFKCACTVCVCVCVCVCVPTQIAAMHASKLGAISGKIPPTLFIHAATAIIVFHRILCYIVLPCTG